MSYPIWDVPAPGLLIAGIAILHVYISHFAVGGGLFLVLAERRARRTADAGMLAYVESLSRFFILLTLVLGAVTGVGIWFTIGLVSPMGTSALINAFVWGWAIEWTFFVIEIAAAIVYYYGWRRLDAKTHEAVGWIYFVAAWMSLVIINGILSFMATPGRWLETRSFWDGFFNPTYVSSLVLRTLVAVGIAGLFALFAAARLGDGELKQRIARWTATRWILPAAIGVPLCLLWYLGAAAGAGIPVAEIFGATSSGPGALVASVFASDHASGYPPAQRAALVAAIAYPAIVVLTLALLWLRPRNYGRLVTALMLLFGIAGMGAGEWAREDLRKPWIIGGYMYVNGVRVPPPAGATGPAAEAARRAPDPFRIDVLNERGLLESSVWLAVPAGAEPEDPADRLALTGRQVFRGLCSTCHTVDGYLAIRPLVRGQKVAALERLLERLDAHRQRRMPPFAGTDEERHALAVWLARLGGDETAGREVAPAATTGHPGAALFEDQCSLCHAADADFPMAELVAGRGADELYDIIGRLPEINDMMPAFEGTDEERRALAEYLASLEAE